MDEQHNKLKFKFKIGDIVTVLPYEKFDYHLGISSKSWHYEQKIKKHTIQSVNAAHHQEDGVDVYSIQYGLQNGFTWLEKYLEFYEIPEFLTDNDFEI